LRLLSCRVGFSSKFKMNTLTATRVVFGFATRTLSRNLD